MPKNSIILGASMNKPITGAVIIILYICAFLAGYWVGKPGPGPAPPEIVLHELGVVQVAYGQTSATLPTPPPYEGVKAPYIYVHGPYGSKVSVNVTFTNGSPTLVIPEAAVTENSISWENVTVTDNGLTYQNEPFPYLFYEGELLYVNPLHIEITSPDNYENFITFKVANLGALTLEHIYVFCNPPHAYASVYFGELGPQEQGERTTFIYQPIDLIPNWWLGLEDNIIQAMVSEGIYENEARNLLCGWIGHWIYSTCAIYRIPSPVIEEILPLDIQVPSGAELTSKRILWAMVENIPLYHLSENGLYT